MFVNSGTLFHIYSTRAGLESVRPHKKYFVSYLLHPSCEGWTTWCAAATVPSNAFEAVYDLLWTHIRILIPELAFLFVAVASARTAFTNPMTLLKLAVRCPCQTILASSALCLWWFQIYPISGFETDKGFFFFACYLSKFRPNFSF